MMEKITVCSLKKFDIVCSLMPHLCIPTFANLLYKPTAIKQPKIRLGIRYFRFQI
jgi:hypothetical protein